MLEMFLFSVHFFTNNKQTAVRFRGLENYAFELHFQAHGHIIGCARLNNLNGLSLYVVSIHLQRFNYDHESDISDAELSAWTMKISKHL